jgi:hypothetical protein
MAIPTPPNKKPAYSGRVCYRLAPPTKQNTDGSIFTISVETIKDD